MAPESRYCLTAGCRICQRGMNWQTYPLCRLYSAGGAEYRCWPTDQQGTSHGGHALQLSAAIYDRALIIRNVPRPAGWAKYGCPCALHKTMTAPLVCATPYPTDSSCTCSGGALPSWLPLATPSLSHSQEPPVSHSKKPTPWQELARTLNRRAVPSRLPF